MDVDTIFSIFLSSKKSSGIIIEFSSNRITSTKSNSILFFSMKFLTEIESKFRILKSKK